ncbi:hypothetical protein [Erwinia billingiae]|uniref:hypothetical protein n=1 Tax=Erwinia billingiae TaxID=182337 RepID=UPI00069FD6FE|nr:hypothetical protein [Erwinia billingiae]
MNFLGKLSDSNIPHYGLSRNFGGISAKEIDFKSLEDGLDCSRNFNRVGIIYNDGARRWLVRPSRVRANTHQSLVTHVVITKIPNVVQPVAETAVIDAISSPSLAGEITSTAFACGAMVITLMLAFGAGAAVPFTAGGSGIFAGISIAGSLATGAQCFIGSARIIALSKGHSSDVAWLDSQDWYVATSTALDMISLAAAGTGLKATIETYKLMKSASSAKLSEWFKSLSRADRKRITEEIIRKQNPGISNNGVKAAIQAGMYPKRFPADSLQRTLQRELINALVNTSAFTGSALTGTIRNPQNLVGSTRYAVGLIQSLSKS